MAVIVAHPDDLVLWTFACKDGVGAYLPEAEAFRRHANDRESVEDDRGSDEDERGSSEGDRGS